MSLISTVSFGLIAKKILNDQNRFHPVALGSAMFILIGISFFIVYLTQGVLVSDIRSLLDPKVISLLALNLGVYTLSPTFYFRALQKLPISIVTIVYSLTGLFALIVESVLGINMVGLLSSLTGSLLIIFSVILVYIKGSEVRLSRYTIMILLASASYALAAVLDRQLLSHFSDVFYLAVTFMIPGILLLPLNLLSPKKIIQPYRKKNLRLVVISALPIALSFFFTFRAYHFGGTAGQVYSVLSLEAVITVIAAAIFLKERQDLILKALAAIVAGLGVYLLAI